METPALPRRLALTAGCNQLINWGISFYMPGTFAMAISADRGWSSPQIYLGLTLAILEDATLVRTVLVPAFMHLLGRWSWWAPAPLVWLHKHIGITHGESDPSDPTQRMVPAQRRDSEEVQ